MRDRRNLLVPVTITLHKIHLNKILKKIDLDVSKLIKALFGVQVIVCLQQIIFEAALANQGHPTDRFGGISVRETCNRLKFSVREIPSRAFLINAFCFRRDKNDVLGTKIGQK